VAGVGQPTKGIMTSTRRNFFATLAAFCLAPLRSFSKPKPVVPMVAEITTKTYTLTSASNQVDFNLDYVIVPPWFVGALEDYRAGRVTEMTDDMLVSAWADLSTKETK
jgi:hypothetical protein